MHPLILELSGVRKAYAGRTVLDGVDLDLGSGTCALLFGRNGSGKSTLLRIAASLLPADNGSVRRAGIEARFRDPTGRRAMYFLDAESAPLLEMTGRESLQMSAAFWGVSDHIAAQRIGEFLSFASLNDAADRPVAGYSLGMRKQLGLGCGLMVNAALMILDEPFEGLDPHATREYLELFARYVSQPQRAILASSHDPSAFDAHPSFRSLVIEAGQVRDARPPSIEPKVPSSRGDKTLSWL